jgi:hypothetical protein
MMWRLSRIDPTGAAFFYKRSSRTAGTHRILEVSTGYYTTNSSPGVIGVIFVPGDEMTMTVHNSLAGCTSDIIPDVIPVRCEIILDDNPAFINKLDHCYFLFSGKCKIIRSMPERDYQKMSLGDREMVPAGIT